MSAGLRVAIRAYQLIVSPLLPPSCRFLPSCSDYAIEALERHGALVAGASRCGGSPAATRGAAAATIRCLGIGRPTGALTAGMSAPATELLTPIEMEQRNLLIAIVLSVGILIAFQFVFERLRPPPVPHVTPTNTATATQSPASATTAGAPGAAAPSCRDQRRRSRARRRSPSQPRIKIDTPRLHGSITLVGARLDDLTLATYHETVDPKSPEVVLLSPPGTANPYLAEFGWVAASPRR